MYDRESLQMQVFSFPMQGFLLRCRYQLTLAPILELNLKLEAAEEFARDNTLFILVISDLHDGFCSWDEEEVVSHNFLAMVVVNTYTSWDVLLLGFGGAGCETWGWGALGFSWKALVRLRKMVFQLKEIWLGGCRRNLKLQVVIVQRGLGADNKEGEKRREGKKRLILARY